MLTISGGKLTSFLSMAANCLDTIEQKYNITHLTNSEIKITSLIDRYKERYGIKNATLIANIIQQEQNEALADSHEKYPYSIAEFLFFIRHQSAVKIDDLLTRRTLISYQMQQFDEVFVASVADLLSKELHWTEAQKAQAVSDYKEAWQLMHSWG
jgi:glycerol-3-phosphate dehydrogenase